MMDKAKHIKRSIYPQWRNKASPEQACKRKQDCQGSRAA